MAWIAGVDGCKAGWFRVCLDTDSGGLQFDVLPTFKKVVFFEPAPKIITVDIPIGLPDSGSRQCDIAARAELGKPRSNSVFPAPIRPALMADTREEASQITEAADGRRVGAQSWGIYQKVREVDELLQKDHSKRPLVYEVHPEVCFWAWAGQKPMNHKKKSTEGKLERLHLAEKWLGPGILEKARGGFLKKYVADDDILDAIAALWTAQRIKNCGSKVLPSTPLLDTTSLPMQMVY